MMSHSSETAWCTDRERSIDVYRHHNNANIHFGKVSSSKYGLYLTGIRIADSPRRDVSFLSVPGRNGDLIVDNKRWHNIDITYSFAIATGFARQFDAFKADLLMQTGYQKLTDSIYPDLYRMAIVKESIKPETARYNRTGKFEVTFHCKPQRFLRSGIDTHTFSEIGTIRNNTGFPALPLITVFGNGAGSVTIGGTTVTIKDMTDQLILDCDTQNAYRQVGDGAPENLNGSIYAPQFPTLAPGKNAISWSGGVTKIEIIPRWWTL